MSDKESIRVLMKAKLRELDPIQRGKMNNHIFTTLSNWDLIKQSTSIGIYVSLNNEIDTHALIKWGLQQNKIILVPKITSTEHNTMVFCKINDFEEDLKIGEFNILSPVDSIQPWKHKIDVIIIPGLTFDLFGNRIGKGKGYFDRYLFNSNAIKIGLAFNIQIQEQIPSEITDVKMNYIVTESQIIEVN
ncbi:MAG: 5-formyltetrahydrofolate cyclo-ligase [Candidatus Heimdallarchaeota archaeon]|nr:5-formyltetrahydrofolate cyclo-ligase [Candidatus Heimdallarchaeota archaeon]MDH5647192.1 5-formyltetrahydrofolate cyclo-ligase [Candidatus Heimdallarchaeota archaeon]